MHECSGQLILVTIEKAMILYEALLGGLYGTKYGINTAYFHATHCLIRNLLLDLQYDKTKDVKLQKARMMRSNTIVQKSNKRVGLSEPIMRNERDVNLRDLKVKPTFF